MYYDRLTTVEAPEFMVQPKVVSGAPHYRRALVCVALAAALLLLLVGGVLPDLSGGWKLLIGLGFLLFAVLTMHFTIAALRPAPAESGAD